MESISQKEYLKKYLSGDKDKKKKKRKKKDIVSDRVKIIDDVIDIAKINSAEAAEDLLLNNEDAPQIVGVIDDRPLHMRVNDYQQSDLWRPLGAAGTDDADSNFTGSMFQKEKEFLLKLIKKEASKDVGSISLNKLQKLKGQKKNKDLVSRWNIGGNSVAEGEISSMKSQADDSSPRTRTRTSSDGGFSINSSPTKCTNSIETDCSPPRKSKNDDDFSPPRRTRNDDISPSRKSRCGDISPPRKSRGGDISPPRKSKLDDITPPRKSRQCNSPPQRSERRYKTPQKTKRDDNSPPRKHRRSDCSPPHKRDREGDRRQHSPKRKLLPGDKKGKYVIPAKRMEKTLDGKTAGLQSAQQLLQENEAFRKREENLFKNMSDEVSGVNATTVIRDRKTGKVRDLKKEAEERLEKEKQNEVNKEKYSRWGKGLKQVEDYENKLQQDLIEMNKPLARYADDEDLERYLKEQDREGDPMLSYIKKKRRKNDVETGKPIKPQFEGEFMPNRFGIRPGHRWDGVDRSNGYEKKWIEVQNAKQAIQEEVYKWSTEDM